MKSTPKVTDGPARTGISGTWAAKISDKRGLSVGEPVEVSMLGPILAADGLGRGVTNTSDLSFLVSAHGLDGGVWKDSKL
jgi:hypothetical protein